MTTTTRITNILLALSIAFSLSVTSISSGSAQEQRGYVRRVHVMDAEETGLLNPAGLAYSASPQSFYVIEEQAGEPAFAASSEIKSITPFAEARDLTRVASVLEDPLNIVFDNQNQRLLAFQGTTGALLEVRQNPRGRLDRTISLAHNLAKLGIQEPVGLALDEGTGSLFILDAVGPRIVHVQPAAGRNFSAGKRSVIDLSSSGLVSPRGIAFDAATGHLQVLDSSNQILYELALDGKVVTSRDLASFDLKSPQAMTFAPSGDQTDDPAQMSLFVADSGLASDGTGTSTESSGQIVELSFVVAQALPSGTTLLPTTLVQVIDTSRAVWSPSAPDPAGVDYWPLTGRLLISDSEVDEMSNYFTGKNVFDATLSGALVSTCSTTNSSRTGFSNEPNGIAINRNNNRIYFTDDDANKVHEVSLGSDGQYCTADDQLTTVNLGSVYNIQDAEDVAYGSNRLFIAGGTDAEVYIIPLGADGILGGGDDGPLTRFDTYGLGFTDLEGIGYNWDNNTLLIVSADSTDKYLGEMTITGTLLNAYDLNYSGLTHREDVTYAPSSQNPAVKSIYVADRGIDNNTNSTENDGQIWELSIIPPNTPTPTNTFPPGTVGDSRYLSFASNGTVNGVAFADEDILHFDGQNWSLFFDGSDVGAGSVDLTGLSVMDADTILMAFSANVTLNGLAVTPQDIVRFDATSLGTNTAGTFSMYFNGVDVGFDTTSEKIDALHLLPDGRLLISTTGNPTVPGVSGRDEDVLAFAPTSLGANTSGAWSMYFDGSDVGLGDATSEDIDAVSVAAGNIYLSTNAAFTVSGASGAGEDVFICIPTSVGETTACNFTSGLYFAGSAWGLAGNSVDGFFLSLTNPPTPTNTPTPTATGVVSPTDTPTPTSLFTPTDTPTPTPTSLFTPTHTPTPTATSSSGSTVSTFTPSADAYVRSPDPTGNYGTATTLRAYQNGSSLTSSHLRFSVSGITGPVQTAKLRLYVTDASSTGGGTLYQTVDNSWTETGINYTNQPSTTGSALATLGPVSTGVWIEIDVSSHVTADGVYTFGLLGNSSDVAHYASRETLNRPELVVTYANPN